MECIVIVGIMKNATMKGLIVFDFEGFVKSKRAVAQILFSQNLPHSIRKGILSVRWCSISDPSNSPSALECETHPPSPWGSSRDAFAHSLPHMGRTLEALKMVPRSLRNAPFGNTFQT